MELELKYEEEEKMSQLLNNSKPSRYATCTGKITKCASLPDECTGWKVYNVGNSHHGTTITWNIYVRVIIIKREFRIAVCSRVTYLAALVKWWGHEQFWQRVGAISQGCKKLGWTGGGGGYWSHFLIPKLAPATPLHFLLNAPKRCSSPNCVSALRYVAVRPCARSTRANR